MLTLNRGIAATLEIPAGEGRFPAVLMFHGLGSSRDEVGIIFADTAAALAMAGIASLRIDLRGFGKSDGDTGAFTLERQNEDAAIALQALADIEQTDAARIGAMGFSFGAGAAIELAAAQPDAIRSLLQAAVGDDKRSLVIEGGDHVFHVYTPSRSMAGQVIEATVARFRDTLGRAR